MTLLQHGYYSAWLYYSKVTTAYGCVTAGSQQRMAVVQQGQYVHEQALCKAAGKHEGVSCLACLV